MFGRKKKTTVKYMENVLDLDEIDDLELFAETAGEGGQPENEQMDESIAVNQDAPKAKEDSWMKELISTAIYLLVVVALTFLFVQFVGQRTHVTGNSMNVTLQDGDNLIVDKLSYRFSDPERYDIIVFPYKYKEQTYYIKRIIGMPGETVQVIDGFIYIDGEILEESYGKEVMKYAGIASEPITLGEDEYFVLGDNRNDSSDSRDPSVGTIQKEDIVGKAFLRIWPLNKFGLLKHQ